MPHRPPHVTVAVLSLVLGLAALSAPVNASAASPAAAGTTVSGFPQKTKQVTTKQKVYFKIKVNDGTSKPRKVRLQAKSSGRWRTTVKKRTNADGTVRLKWRAPKRAKTTQLRIVVKKAGRSPGATTPARTVVTSQKKKTGGKQSRADRYEAKVFELLNAARAEARTCGGTKYPAVGKLKRNAKLDRAARKFAQQMGDEKFFDHVAPDGSTPTSRARREGYLRGVGENIAAGYPTPASVMNAWLASPGHCQNLMSKRYRDVGIGFAVPGGSAPFANYWVQDFG